VRIARCWVRGALLFESTSSVSCSPGIYNLSFRQHVTLCQDAGDEPNAKRLRPATGTERLEQNSGEPTAKRLYDASVLDLHSPEPGQWLATIKYGTECFEVDSDCLVALEKPTETKTERYLPLDRFDWGKIAERQAKNIAVQCMDQAILMVHDSIEHIALQCLEGQEAKPSRCVLRVVALKDFNIGHLMLTPYCNKDQESSLEMKRLVKPEAEKNNYISRMHLSVTPKDKKKKKSAGEIESTDKFSMRTSFVVQSPLQKLQTKKEFDELSPLWVLPKSTMAKDVNMEMQMIHFDFSPMTPITCKVPSPIKKALFTISMQVATNKRKIKKGDSLILSMMEPDIISSDDEDA
jgi:hypothetical protein